MWEATAHASGHEAFTRLTAAGNNCEKPKNIMNPFVVWDGTNTRAAPAQSREGEHCGCRGQGRRDGRNEEVKVVEKRG